MRKEFVCTGCGAGAIKCHLIVEGDFHNTTPPDACPYTIFGVACDAKWVLEK